MGLRKASNGRPQQVRLVGRLGVAGLLRKPSNGPIAFVGATASKNWLIRPDGTYFNLAPPASSGTVTQMGVCFSADKSLVATAYTSNNTPGYQATIRRVVDGVTMANLPTFNASTTPRSPAFSPDGQYLAFACYAGAPSIVVFRTSDWTQVALPNLPARCDALVWSPDGSHLLCCTGTTPYLWVYDAATWTKQTVSFGAGVPGGNTYAIAITPNGPGGNVRVALSVGGSPYVAQYNYFIAAGVQTFSIQAALQTPPGTGFSSASALSYSSDGKLLAVATTAAPYLFVYDVATGAKLANPATAPAYPVVWLAFAKRANRLAAVQDNGTYTDLVYKASDWSDVTLPVRPDSTCRAVAYG